MKKIYYYIVSTLIFTLLFSFNVSAANTLSYTDEYNLTSGETIKGRGDTFSAIVPDNYDEYTWDISGTVAEWNINENFNILGLSKNKYYNGYLNLNFNLSPTWVSSVNTNTINKDEPILTSTYIKEGLSCYLYRSGSYYTVTITFENYYSGNDTWIGLPTITQKFYSTNYNPPSGVTPSINIPFSYFTLSNYSNLVSTDEPKNIGEIGELNDILEYLKNRPQINAQISNRYIYYSDTNDTYTVYSGSTQNNSYIINKEENVSLIYYFKYAYNVNKPIIVYLTEYMSNITNGQDITQYISRRIDPVKQNTWQYQSIDFQYNEKCVVIFNKPNIEFRGYIGDGYTYQALLYYINRMEEMTPEQSSEAAEVESEYAERDEQSQQLLSGMNSVQMPSISSGDLNILSNIDSTQKVNFFGLIGMITHAEIVTKIMLIIVLGAIVGWILYGKK